MQQQIAAAGQLAAANAGQVTDNQRLQIATEAQNREALNLASTWQGALPASLSTAISKMSATEIQSAGLKLSVNNLGQAVVTLPNGKDIVLTSNGAAEIAKMQALRDAINQIPTTKKSTVEIVTIYSQVGTAAVRTGANSPDVYLYGPHSAAGGLLDQAPLRKFARGGLTDVRAGGRVRGSGGPRQDNVRAWSSRGQVALSRGEYVTPESRVNQQTLPMLDAIRSNNTGLLRAASEAMAAAKGGTRLEEDFSYRGMSGNLATYNDQLASLMYGQTHADAGSADFQSQVSSWLSGFIAQQSAALRSVASAVSAPPAARAAGGGITINVYQQPGQDAHALALQVSRQVALDQKVA
jgi:hypothetical protein